jgi:hypothetical protein
MTHRARMHSIARQLKQNLRTDWGVEGPFQWGTVASVTPGNATTLGVCGVYLDNSSTGTGAVITSGIPYLTAYAPKVGDVVLIARMAGAARTQRVILSVLSTVPGGIGSGTLKNQYCAMGHATVAQSIPTTPPTRINLDTKDYDPNNNLDVTTNKGRYTVPVTGVYLVAGGYEVANQSEVYLEVAKNGNVVRIMQTSGTAGSFTAQGSAIITAAAGDYLEIRGEQPGGAQNTINFSIGAVYGAFEYLHD